MSGPASEGPRAGTIRVEVVHARADDQWRTELVLQSGSTVRDALAAVAGCAPLSGLDLAATAVGIYGERVAPDRVLADHDRVEIYRPLLLDPLEARRRRSGA